MRPAQQIADALTTLACRCAREGAKAPGAIDLSRALNDLILAGALGWVAGLPANSDVTQAIHDELDHLAAGGERLREALENYREN